MIPRLSFLLLVSFAVNVLADPQTRQLEIDFGRDVASRNLKGLATRSDGRILAGPVFTDLTGPKLGEILWMMRASGPNKFIVGTGPDGKVQEVTFNAKDNSYTVRELADVAETHAMAVLPLKDGLLVGTSPAAALYLVKEGKTVARVPLPADSVFDLMLQPDGSVLAATGNPGKIHRIDLKRLAAAGVIEGKAGEAKAAPTDTADKAESGKKTAAAETKVDGEKKPAGSAAPAAKVDIDRQLAERGVTAFGEIRDRNVRRLARLADGRVIAGSSPKGNIYSFPAAGGPPVVLQENRDAEVVDLLPMEDGSVYAALVFTTESASRISRPATPESKGGDTAPKPPVIEDKPVFSGRSSVVRFPADGFPEGVLARPNISLYRLARHNGWLLLTAGELGDTFGYDPAARRTLTFAGSASSQLNDIAPLGDGRYLLLRNNAPGLALMSFTTPPARELETKRLDLGNPADLGALRFARVRGVELKDVRIEARTNFGSDELEGWTPWTPLVQQDEGFVATGLRGRYVKFRFVFGSGSPELQLDKATLHYLPQNRRPALGDFRVFPPNFGVIPAAERPPNASMTVNQLLFPGPRDATKDEGSDKRREAFLGSQVVPAPGTQIVYWSVSDADSDNLAHTFSIRAEHADTWTDLAVNTEANYVQFETGSLPEGLYFTRLAVSEQAPRPAAQRLSYTFETDFLLVDRTPPVIGEPSVTREGGLLKLAVSGDDALSLLEGVEFLFNNGAQASVSHPADGILDGREERFALEIPEAKAAGATSVEIILYDRAGNAASKRVPLK